jgi:hypothetical protein
MGTMIFILIVVVVIYSMCGKSEKEMQVEKVEAILGHDTITPEQRQKKLEHWYNGGNR